MMCHSPRLGFSCNQYKETVADDSASHRTGGDDSFVTGPGAQTWARVAVEEKPARTSNTYGDGRGI